MAVAYNVLANGGLKVEPVTVLRVTDDQGRTLEQPRSPPPPRVAHEETVFLMTSMLRSVVNEGTAAASRAWGFTLDAAGKTGTTNDLRDAWFAGYTPDLLCVVWVGFDDNTPIGLSGAKAALPIWVEFMKGALAGKKTQRLPPAGRGRRLHRYRQGDGSPGHAVLPKVISEAFIAGTEPQERCSAH